MTAPNFACSAARTAWTASSAWASVRVWSSERSVSEKATDFFPSGMFAPR